MDFSSPPSLCTQCKAFEVDVELLLESRPLDPSVAEWEVNLGWELLDQWPGLPQCYNLNHSSCSTCSIVYWSMGSWAMEQDLVNSFGLRRGPSTRADIRLSPCYVLCSDGNDDCRLRSLRLKVYAGM